MKTTFSLLALTLTFGLGTFAGCGGDDDDGDSGGSFNNQMACEDFIGAYNALDCVESASELDAMQVCSGYTDTTVSCANIFDCWTDNMACEDQGGVSVPANYTEGCPTQCGA
jgi:hypothetical protein